MSNRTLVVGATGWLGNQIVDALVSRDLQARVALRGGASHPKAASFAGRAEVVAADLADRASLEVAARGMTTIVSAVQGGRAEIVDGQVALAKAGLEAGAERIVPSDFAVDFRGVSTERHLWLGLRAEADREIAELGLPQANIFNGAFTEVLGLAFFEMLDLEASMLRFWGDADQAYDFTATRDAAAFTAEIVKDRDRLGPQMVLTERVSPRQLAEIASSALRRPFALEQRGGMEELDKEIATRQAAQPDNPYAWAALQYQRLMASGESALRLPVASDLIGEPFLIHQFLSGLPKA